MSAHRRPFAPTLALAAGLLAGLPLAGCGGEEPEATPAAPAEDGGGSDGAGAGSAAAPGDAGEAVRDATERAGEMAEEAVGEAEAAVEEASEQARVMSEEARTAAESYLDALRDLIAGATDVQSQMDALSKSPAIASAADRIREALGAIEALSPEQVAALKEAFRPQLERLNEQYRAQLERIRSVQGLDAVADIMSGIDLLPAGDGS